MSHVRRGLAMSVRTCLSIGLVMTLAVCTAHRGDSETDGDEQSAEVAAAGREVLPLSAEVREAVKEAASLHGKPGARVPQYGAPIFEPGNKDPAFYEVNLAPGWAVVSASDPIEVVELKADGEGPT